MAYSSFDSMTVSLLDLETGDRRELAPGSNPIYSEDG
jgi:hypothetical protein